MSHHQQPSLQRRGVLTTPLQEHGARYMGLVDYIIGGRWRAFRAPIRFSRHLPLVLSVTLLVVCGSKGQSTNSLFILFTDRRYPHRLSYMSLAKGVEC